MRPFKASIPCVFYVLILTILLLGRHYNTSETSNMCICIKILLQISHMIILLDVLI